MYTVSLQLLLKGELSKFLEELLFGTYRARVKGFSAELQNAEVCYFTKKWFNQRRFPSNFKNFANKQRKYLWWTQTQFSVKLLVGELDSSNFLKGTLLNTFSDNSP